MAFAENTLDITPATLTVTADPQSKVYGATNPVFTACCSGYGNGDTGNVLSGEPCLTSAATDSSPVGAYAITVALGSLSAMNYGFSFVDGTLTIGQATLMVTADPQSKAYGAANPVLTGTIIGIQNNDNITATYATTATQTSPVGLYPITPTLVDPGEKLSNYIINNADGTLTITEADSDTTLTSSLNPSLSGSNVTWTATVTSIGPAATTPTGSVQFYTNGISLSAPVALSDGVGGLSTEALPVGTNIVGAAYLSDGNYLGSSDSLVQVVDAIVQTPSAVHIEINSDGSVTVSFLGTPGAQYLVQARSDMAPARGWDNVSTNIAGIDGQWTFKDATPRNLIRFYRAIAP